MDQFHYQNLVSASGAPRINYLDPRLGGYNSLNFQPNSIKVDKDQDRIIIDKWLLEKGKFQINPFLSVPRKKRDISVNVAKKSLKSCLEILEKLTKTQEYLRVNVETMSTNEWKQKTLDIGNLRSDLDKLMLPFEDNVSLIALRSLVKQRLKKRANQKKCKIIKREIQNAKLKARLEAHKNIDRWLENQKEESERAKADEKFKKDADCVLYEVTKQKSEARKHLSLITSLVKLRTVRDNMASQRGDKVSAEDRQAFGKVTEKLIRMWENYYQKYSKEEQSLRQMLEDTAEKDSEAVRFAKEGCVIEEWESLLFGAKRGEHLNNPTYWALTGAERDLETFVAIRKSWDTFLTNPGNTKASRIPIGWVIPSDSPDLKWQALLSHAEFIN